MIIYKNKFNNNFKTTLSLKFSNPANRLCLNRDELEISFKGNQPKYGLIKNAVKNVQNFARNVLSTHTLKQKLIIMQDIAGKSRFTKEEIDCLSKNENLKTMEGEKLFNKFVQMTDTKGNPRFDGYEICDLLNNELLKTLEDGKLFDKFAKIVDIKGNPRFGGYEICNLLKNVCIKTPEDGKLFNKLTQMTDAKGNPRFHGYEISRFLNNEYIRTPEGEKLFNKLTQMIDTEGNLIFNGFEISRLLNNDFLRTPQGEKLLDKFIPMIDAKGNRHIIVHVIEKLFGSKFIQTGGGENFLKFLNGESLSQEKSIKLFNELSELCDENLLSKLALNTKKSVVFSPLPREVAFNFNKALKNIDNSILKLDTKKYKNGLSLEFSRQDFIKQMNETLNKVSSKEKEEIFKTYKFNISDNLTMEGFPEIPEDINSSSEVHSNIQKLITKLTRENKIRLPQNPELEKDLNNIVKAFPEFISIIGKAQHHTHAYTIDIHTIKVLQEFIAHPNYKKLSENDKKIGKLAIIFHDIQKKESSIDKTHPQAASVQAYNLLSKYNLQSTFNINRITDLIKYHSWLEELSAGNKNYVDVALDFITPNDWEISKIFAEADLKSVNNEFYTQYEKDLKTSVDKIDTLIDRIHSKGVLLPQTRIPKTSNLRINPVEIISNEGNTKNKVIILNGINDFEKLGFAKGTAKNNFGVLAHTLNKENELGIVSALKYKGKEGILSTSYVTAENFNTFYDNQYGVIISAHPSSIIVANKENLHSGNKKGIDFVRKLIPFEDNFSKKVMAKGFSKDEYLNIYRNFYPKVSATEIPDEKLKKALLDTTEKVIINKKEHNEVVVWGPEISGIFAKNCNPDSVPYYLRKYAEDNNVPIVIFGKK